MGAQLIPTFANISYRNWKTVTWTDKTVPSYLQKKVIFKESLFSIKTKDTHLKWCNNTSFTLWKRTCLPWIPSQFCNTDPIEGLLQSKPGLSYPSHQSSEQAHSHLPQPQPKDTEEVRNFTSREKGNSKRGTVRQCNVESINLDIERPHLFFTLPQIFRIECYSPHLKSLNLIPSHATWQLQHHPYMLHYRRIWDLFQLKYVNLSEQTTI